MASLARTLLSSAPRRQLLSGSHVLHDHDDQVLSRTARATPQAFFSSHPKTRETEKPAPGVRKKMVPLIKLVHPDLFAQYPPNVASTNSRSLKDLNTLIDAAENLEAARNGTGSTSPPAVESHYTLTFFYHEPERGSPPDGHQDRRAKDGRRGVSSRRDRRDSPGDRQRDDKVNVGEDGQLAELRAELRFAPALSSDPRGSLRHQLRRQLEGLLRRLPGIDHGEVAASKRGLGEGGDSQEEKAMLMGVRVREGETEEGYYGPSYRGMSEAGRAPPRKGVHMERDAAEGRSGEKTKKMTPEELRDMTITHAADNHHRNPWAAGSGPGFFGGGVWGPDVNAQARSRRVDDFLRSGRVQFAGVPISREAAALSRLHQVLVKNFDDLELEDRGLWSTVVIVVRARSSKYEVQAHAEGPLITVPEKFTERNLILFLAETLLSYT